MYRKKNDEDYTLELKKHIQKYRSSSEESNGVICFLIRDSFHVEIMFVPKTPIETAEMIELGKEQNGQK